MAINVAGLVEGFGWAVAGGLLALVLALVFLRRETAAEIEALRGQREDLRRGQDDARAIAEVLGAKLHQADKRAEGHQVARKLALDTLRATEVSLLHERGEAWKREEVADYKIQAGKRLIEAIACYESCNPERTVIGKTESGRDVFDEPRRASDADLANLLRARDEAAEILGWEGEGGAVSGGGGLPVAVASDAPIPDFVRFLPKLTDPGVEPRPPGCSCTWEQGDSACPVHPTCPGCGCIVCECAPAVRVARLHDQIGEALDADRVDEARELTRRWALAKDQIRGAETAGTETIATGEP